MSIHILHPVTCSTAPSLVDVLILRLLIMLDTDNYFEPDELIIASLGFNIGPFTHFREICDLPFTQRVEFFLDCGFCFVRVIPRITGVKDLHDTSEHFLDMYRSDGSSPRVLFERYCRLFQF